jgi:hypothetical protein
MRDAMKKGIGKWVAGVFVVLGAGLATLYAITRKGALPGSQANPWDASQAYMGPGYYCWVNPALTGVVMITNQADYNTYVAGY